VQFEFPKAKHIPLESSLTFIQFASAYVRACVCACVWSIDSPANAHVQLSSFVETDNTTQSVFYAKMSV